MVVPLNVRLHRQCRHHRNDVQEQNHIGNKWIRHLLAQKDLEAGPENLRAQPHSAAQRHESPEKLLFLIAGSDV